MGEVSESEKEPLQRTLRGSLKRVVGLGKWVDFATSYGEAIENVWVTILMVVHGIANEFDSFVWIIPVVLAIIIRYVHRITQRAYREANLVGYFLIIGGIGCFVVGFSCDLHKKKYIVLRLVQGAIGWTIMDVAYELCLFFNQKLAQTHSELESSEPQQSVAKDEQSTPLWRNWCFIGLLLGYLFSIAVCFSFSGQSIRAFYKCAKYAYFSAGVIGVLAGLRYIVEVKLSLPHREQQSSSLPAQRISSLSLAYFLPGYDELVSCSIGNISLLGVHFIVMFLNDIVVIYTTIQFAEPAGMDFPSDGTAYLYGIVMGSVALICYTFMDNLTLKISRPPAFVLNSFLIFTAAVSLYAFFSYNIYSFFAFSLAIALLSQLYRLTVLKPAQQDNSIFQRCQQLVERLEMLFVLSGFPIFPLLIFDRDDVSDCLAWSSGACIVGLILYQISRMSKDKSDLKED